MCTMLTCYKPTGGPILLDDTQPDEPKTLIEEKLKKVTTERAPVAGAAAGAGATPRNAAQSLLSNWSSREMSGGNNIRELNELLQLTARGAEGRAAQVGGGSGAAAAAGVLTAVDEDNEGDEEAPAPADFEYFTDAEEDD